MTIPPSLIKTGSVNWTLCFGVPEGVEPGVSRVEGVAGEADGLRVAWKEFLIGEARGEVCRDVKGDARGD